MIESNKYRELEIPTEDITYVVEFCNTETSSQLLAVGTGSKVSVYQCKFRVRFYNRLFCHMYPR